MKKLTRFSMVAAVLVGSLAFSSFASAATVPQTVTQQGRLFNADNTTFDGMAKVTFRIYDAETNGTVLFEETLTVTFIDGYFSVSLGETSDLGAAFDGSVRYVGITIADDQEMSPRVATRSVPYAMIAGDVIGDIHPTSISIGGTVVIDENGTWLGDPTGLVGPTGADGAMGPIGATGADGAMGPIGATGAAGAQGAQGIQGLMGATGAAGAQGIQGPIGPTGAAGAAGAQGIQGPIGPIGPIGPTGAAGAQGAQGIQGPIGATGANGAMGPMGATGAAGAQGIQGPIGPIGATGAAGAQGIQGPIGPTGATGAAGAAGATGATGAPGATGATGASGVAKSLNFDGDWTQAIPAGTMITPATCRTVAYTPTTAGEVAIFNTSASVLTPVVGALNTLIIANVMFLNGVATPTFTNTNNVGEAIHVGAANLGNTSRIPLNVGTSYVFGLLFQTTGPVTPSAASCNGTVIILKN